MSMNATKRKRQLGKRAGADKTKQNTDDTNYSVRGPDGRPAITLTPAGVVLIHDERMLEAAPHFLPPGAKIFFGPPLDEVEGVPI